MRIGTYTGLLAGKTAIGISARGDSYAEDGHYIELWLKFIGIADRHAVVVEQTLHGPDAAAARQKGIGAAQAIVARL